MQTLPYEIFFPETFRFGVIEIVAQNFEVWNCFHSLTKEGERLTRKSSRGTGSVAKPGICMFFLSERVESPVTEHVICKGGCFVMFDSRFQNLQSIETIPRFICERAEHAVLEFDRVPASD